MASTAGPDHTTIARATLKYHRGSPQKARLVVDQIRGKNVDQALSLLHLSPKAVARPIEKLLRSAVANAEKGEERVDIDTLWVGEAYVGQGPTYKRFRGRAFGRAFMILHRTCHITVKLFGPVPGIEESAGPEPKARAAGKTGARGVEKPGTSTRKKGAATPGRGRKSTAKDNG